MSKLETFNLRLAPDERAMLDALAEEGRKSAADWLRTMVRGAYESNGCSVRVRMAAWMKEMHAAGRGRMWLAERRAEPTEVIMLWNTKAQSAWPELAREAYRLAHETANMYDEALRGFTLLASKPSRLEQVAPPEASFPFLVSPGRPLPFEVPL